MKLEYLFFKSHFYPFILSVFLCTLVITTFVSIFTSNYYDERTCKNIIDLEKKKSKININSANVLVSIYFSKLQIILNELILYYQKIAKDLLQDENSHIFQNEYLVSAVTVDDDFCYDYYYETDYMGVWSYDTISTNEYIDDLKKDVKQQLIAYSNIIPNLEIIYKVMGLEASHYFFYFDKTELFITFPLSYECDNNWLGVLKNYSKVYKNTNCMNENGENYDAYKMKCVEFFKTMLKSETGAFDNNYLLSQKKTILINNFFYTVLVDVSNELR